MTLNASRRVSARCQTTQLARPIRAHAWPNWSSTWEYLKPGGSRFDLKHDYAAQVPPAANALVQSASALLCFLIASAVLLASSQDALAQGTGGLDEVQSPGEQAPPNYGSLGSPVRLVALDLTGWRQELPSWVPSYDPLDYLGATLDYKCINHAVDLGSLKGWQTYLWANAMEHEFQFSTAEGRRGSLGRLVDPDQMWKEPWSRRSVRSRTRFGFHGDNPAYLLRGLTSRDDGSFGTIFGLVIGDQLQLKSLNGDQVSSRSMPLEKSRRVGRHPGIPLSVLDRLGSRIEFVTALCARANFGGLEQDQLGIHGELSMGLRVLDVLLEEESLPEAAKVAPGWVDLARFEVGDDLSLLSLTYRDALGSIQAELRLWREASTGRWTRFEEYSYLVGVGCPEVTVSCQWKYGDPEQIEDPFTNQVALSAPYYDYTLGVPVALTGDPRQAKLTWLNRALSVVSGSEQLPLAAMTQVAGSVQHFIADSADLDPEEVPFEFEYCGMTPLLGGSFCGQVKLRNHGSIPIEVVSVESECFSSVDDSGAQVLAPGEVLERDLILNHFSPFLEEQGLWVVCRELREDPQDYRRIRMSIPMAPEPKLAALPRLSYSPASDLDNGEPLHFSYLQDDLELHFDHCLIDGVVVPADLIHSGSNSLFGENHWGWVTIQSSVVVDALRRALTARALIVTASQLVPLGAHGRRCVGIVPIDIDFVFAKPLEPGGQLEDPGQSASCKLTLLVDLAAVDTQGRGASVNQFHRSRGLRMNIGPADEVPRIEIESLTYLGLLGPQMPLADRLDFKIEIEGDRAVFVVERQDDPRLPGRRWPRAFLVSLERGEQLERFLLLELTRF